ncbi:hypothetical protein DUI87_15214 [Hirundo rustica rustica]|uniref:Uncharacterized protein n=1 Tax=Hirundo rustica rustica TaxID=333673 RepID=A0A3M0KAV7_HIRRU|nr:hypothetical protein DUI87_15214 [Hirundo rustica rustica]
MGSVWWLLLCIPVLSPAFAGGVIRVYYLGIHEVNWNYAPTGRNVLANQSIAQTLLCIMMTHSAYPFEFNSQASAFLQSGKDRVGSTYKKSVYKQYTDSTYTTEIPKTRLLGFLGPVIRAEVGDTLKNELLELGSPKEKEEESSAINGYVFGNLPDVKMCAGDSVSWYLFGMGNEIDIHTAYFHGETLKIRGHRTDVASLFPATFVTAYDPQETLGDGC